MLPCLNEQVTRVNGSTGKGDILNDYFMLYYLRGVEQLVVHQAHNLEVIGSSPIPANICVVNP